MYVLSKLCVCPSTLLRVVKGKVFLRNTISSNNLLLQVLMFYSEEIKSSEIRGGREDGNGGRVDKFYSSDLFDL